jgi:hypothetical protein
MLGGHPYFVERNRRPQRGPAIWNGARRRIDCGGDRSVSRHKLSAMLEPKLGRCQMATPRVAV